MSGLIKTSNHTLLWLVLFSFCISLSVSPSWGADAEAAESPSPATYKEVERKKDQANASEAKQDSTAQDSNSQSTTRQVPNLYQQRQQSIEQITQEIADKNQVVWLEQGKTRVAALHQLATVRRPQGTILLLHGNHAHLDQEGIIRTLRTKLPESNWNTFSLSLPEFSDEEAIPKRKFKKPSSENSPDKESETKDTKNKDLDKKDNKEDKTEPTNKNSESNHPETDPDTVMPEIGAPPQDAAAPPVIEPEFPEEDKRPPKVILSERLQLALDYLAREPRTGKIIIVVEDIMASWVCDLLATELMAPEIRGLVLINAQMPMELEATPLSVTLPQLRIPVLDLVSETVIDTPANKNRYLKLRQTGRKNYEYNSISSVNASLGYEDRDLVLNKIRGWLRRRFEKVKIPGVTPL